ncbi:ubiquinone/menaquinone biosynthesis C-methyltransferase UbiE [mine drainage metagenome]|uniref:Ubiquinone/menaquinone biosynthesis C-methyltransferase UbiE n=1 Tax=mine drainage metagenome TaxID=410659 RepID=A0A1J5Q692_9ZZZZ
MTWGRLVLGPRVWPVRGLRSHPFADRWNHNTHYFPVLASRIPGAVDRVLDVGCGDGTFCRFVARDGRRVVGVDIDASAFPADSAGVRYGLASAEDLPFAAGTFGVVTMTMVLHHVQAERALAEAARVVAPGGVLLVLGYGRYGGWRDAPHEVRDLLTHRLVSHGMRPWDPPSAKAEPSDTWSQARATARDALPGSSYRRLAMWRYLVEWPKPR